MAGGSIKGITISFRGDTTKLEKALRTVQDETRKIDQELRKVDRSLKFNPKSVELWKQKQTLLTKSITETEDKLKLLKRQQEAMDSAKVDKNSAEYRKLQREIIATESKLKKLKSELISVGQVNLRALGEQFKDMGNKVTKAGEAMAKFSAVAGAGIVASTKSALGYSDAIAKMSTISDDAQVSVKDLKKQILDLSNQTGKSATELAEASYQALSASVETRDVVGFVAEATALAKAGFLDTASAVDVLTTIINAYGYSAEDANLISNQLIQTQNDGKTTVNELAQAMGQVIPTASALNIPLEQLNASYVAMTKQGINTANATTYLNGMFTELADGGSDVSEILQETTGKTFGQLMKDGASLGDILKILSDSVDGDGEAFLNLWGNVRAGRGALSLLNNGVDEFNSEVDVMAHSTGNVEEALGKLSTEGASARKALNMLVNVGIQIGDIFAPYVEKLALAIQSLVDRFNALSPTAKSVIGVLMAIVASIAPVLLIGGKLLSGIGSLLIGLGRFIGLIKMVIPIVSTVLGVIGTSGAVFLGVAGAVIALGVLIYKNWDKIKAWTIAMKDKIVQTFTQLKTNTVNMVNAFVNEIKAKWSSLKTFASTTFNNIKTAIVTPIKNAVDKVKSIIDRIKGFFPINVGKILKGIKIPKFSISGKFSLNPPSIPKISMDWVNWYKDGGIFDSPSLIGVGEAGKEAVVPLDKLWNKLDNLQSGETVVNIYVNGANKDPVQIAQEVKRILIKEVKGQNLAFG